jgi:multidrug efflux pump
MLTLYTTPVVYLALDRLRLRVMGEKRDTFNPGGGPVPVAAD